MIWLVPFIGALSNWLIRGGGLKQWFPKFRGGDLLNAFLFAVISGLLMTPIVGLICGIGMFIGSMFSIFNKHSDIAIQERDYKRWALIVWERGIVWVTPIILPLALICGASASWFFIPAFLMPIAYAFVWMPYFNKWSITNWAASELVFGFVLWLPLCLIK